MLDVFPTILLIGFFDAKTVGMRKGEQAVRDSCLKPTSIHDVVGFECADFLWRHLGHFV